MPPIDSTTGPDSDDDELEVSAGSVLDDEVVSAVVVELEVELEPVSELELSPLPGFDGSEQATTRQQVTNKRVQIIYGA